MTPDWPTAMFENYVFALSRMAALGPAGAAERVGPWLCIDAGIGTSAFNVAVLRDEPGDCASALRVAEAWYESRNVNIRLDLRADKDAGMVTAALMAGYLTWGIEPALLLESFPSSWPPVAGFRSTPVRSAEDVATYAGLDREEHSDTRFQELMTRRAVDLPGCDLVIGWLDGVPAARALAVTTGDLTGVHNVYVPPSLRGRGLGAAITAAAADAGRSRGAAAACLEATPLGLPVYERMGFTKVTEYVTLGKGSPP